MKLPNANSAIVDEAKVRDYLLSPEHPVGHFKARVFMAAGYRRQAWQRLREDLTALAATVDAELARTDEYGQLRPHREPPRSQRQALASGHGLACTFRGRFAAPDHRVSEAEPMSIRELDSVVLERDVPEHGLRKGDLGAVVHVYAPDAFEVEFVRASGNSQALVRLTQSDVRAVEDNDVPAVRNANPRRGVA
jgi:hypothetical protein